MRYLLVFCLCIFGKNLVVSNEVKIGNAAVGEYPHMVALRLAGSEKYECGGAIVDEEWILTAAHCVINTFPSDWTVMAGSNKLSQGGDFYQVLEIHPHELFKYGGYVNDVAILKVERIKFTEKVNKIKLGKAFVGGGVSVTLSSWGVISRNGTFPDNLQHRTYKTTTVGKCQKRTSGLPIDDAILCTLHKAGVGVCRGDSGSPLIRSVDGVRYMVGLVSEGYNCGLGFYPDLYSRISSFVSWFDEKCNCNL